MFREKVNLKSFTLIELMLTIILMAIVYTIATSTINLNKVVQEKSLTFFNLHNYLLKLNLSFQDSLKIKCAEEEICFITTDNQVSKKINNTLFKDKPQVYSYSKDLKRIEFKRLELENLESYDIVFEYSINKQKKSNDMVVEVDDKIFIFNSFKNQVIQLQHLNEVIDYFQEKTNKVKDAF